MKKSIIAVSGLWLFFACTQSSDKVHTLSAEALRNKIAGGWAGKMIGVTYGAPTEFRALGKTYDDSIHWTPADIRGSLWQDDIYVQLTFMMTMDKYGIDAPAKKFQEMFAKAGYMLWHANAQSRKNYYDSIFPPSSGRPEFNVHADDIDFQIEADYIGFMCPGMPATALAMADKIGHIMNYGDGVYGGVFLAALYCEAFFETDIPKIIDTALKSLPAESDYAKMINDAITLHRHYPNDWKAAWRELQDKWGDDHFCGAGSDFNIDAKLNGAYIAMGLLYGEGNPAKTLEITTRCGQDSDCNPSSAMAVLGVVMGFDNLPQDMKDGVTYMGDSLFINTDYSFNKAVENTYKYAVQLIAANGGKATEQEITVVKQSPTAPALEVSFPDVVVRDKTISVFDAEALTLTGNWKTVKRAIWPSKELTDMVKFSSAPGDYMEINFFGTGLSIEGNWMKDGGMADVYLDGKKVRIIDTYFFYNNQEGTDYNISLWHVTGLQEGKHTVRLTVNGQKNPQSLGTSVYISRAIIFKTAPKKSASHKFSFQR